MATYTGRPISGGPSGPAKLVTAPKVRPRPCQKDSLYARTLKKLAKDIDGAGSALRARRKAGDLSAAKSALQALESDVAAIDAQLLSRLERADTKIMELEAGRQVLEAEEAEAAASSLNMTSLLQVQSAHGQTLATEIERAESMLLSLRRGEAALVHQASLQDIEFEHLSIMASQMASEGMESALAPLKRFVRFRDWQEDENGGRTILSSIDKALAARNAAASKRKKAQVCGVGAEASMVREAETRAAEQGSPGLKDAGKAEEEARNVTEESKKAEEERRVKGERKKVEEERVKEEQKKAEEERRVKEEQKKAEEERRVKEEQKKAEEERRVKEEQKLMQENSAAAPSSSLASAGPAATVAPATEAPAPTCAPAQPKPAAAQKRAHTLGERSLVPSGGLASMFASPSPWEGAFAKKILEKKEKQGALPVQAPEKKLFSFAASSKGKEAKLPLHMRIVDLKTPGKKAPDIVPRGGAAAATLADREGQPAAAARARAGSVAASGAAQGAAAPAAPEVVGQPLGDKTAVGGAAPSQPEQETRAKEQGVKPVGAEAGGTIPGAGVARGEDEARGGEAARGEAEAGNKDKEEMDKAAASVAEASQAKDAGTHALASNEPEPPPAAHVSPDEPARSDGTLTSGKGEGVLAHAEAGAAWGGQATREVEARQGGSASEAAKEQGTEPAEDIQEDIAPVDEDAEEIAARAADAKKRGHPADEPSAPQDGPPPPAAPLQSGAAVAAAAPTSSPSKRRGDLEEEQALQQALEASAAESSIQASETSDGSAGAGAGTHADEPAAGRGGGAATTGGDKLAEILAKKKAARAAAAGSQS